MDTGLRAIWGRSTCALLASRAIPKTSKTVHPVQSGEHILGLSLDTRNNAIRIGIPPDRLSSLRSSMAEFERCYRQ